MAWTRSLSQRKLGHKSYLSLEKKRSRETRATTRSQQPTHVLTQGFHPFLLSLVRRPVDLRIRCRIIERHIQRAARLIIALFETTWFTTIDCLPSLRSWPAAHNLLSIFTRELSSILSLPVVTDPIRFYIYMRDQQRSVDCTKPAACII